MPKPLQKPSKQITQGVKLTPDTRARLTALAAQKDRTLHWLMVKAVDEYIEREERYEREKHEDRKRWENYAQTGAHISQSDMVSWMRNKISSTSHANHIAEVAEPTPETFDGAPRVDGKP